MISLKFVKIEVEVEGCPGFKMLVRSENLAKILDKSCEILIRLWQYLV